MGLLCWVDSPGSPSQAFPLLSGGRSLVPSHPAVFRTGRQSLTSTNNHQSSSCEIFFSFFFFFFFLSFEFASLSSQNHDMTLGDFKKIFWMEWGHRQVGRFIGLEFLVGGAFFISRGWVSRSLALRMGGIAALIGFQGLIGWLMVKSGLDHQIVEDRAVARVSHYRLAAHLGTAFTIYAAMLWTGFDLLTKPLKDPKVLEALRSPKVARFRTFSLVALGMVATTAMSGALVAGLDAGLVYNEFPLMGGLVIPTDILSLSPKWRNFFDNATTVQFTHRYLALTTATGIGALFLYAKKLPLPRPAKLAVHMLAGMAAIQVTLGITTLLWFVPIPLASTHQAGSVALLSFALWLVHTLKIVPK